MIVKGDKIELVKEIRIFKKIGTKFEVDRIDEDGNITFNFWSCDSEIGRPGRATMTYREFEKYFKIVPKRVQRVWSEWMLTNIPYFGFIGQHLNRINVEYRTNGKTVQVRPQRVYSTSINRLRGEATCSPSDDFDVNKGLAIAKMRLAKKLSDFSYERFEEGLRI